MTTGQKFDGILNFTDFFMKNIAKFACMQTIVCKQKFKEGTFFSFVFL